MILAFAGLGKYGTALIDGLKSPTGQALVAQLASEKVENALLGAMKGSTGDKEITLDVPLEELGSTCQGNRKALFIGINYFNTQSELRGCINDVINIRQFVQSKYGFADSNITQLTDDQAEQAGKPTRANIIQALHWLVAGCAPGDSLFLHYSGHGGSVKDVDGDEVDGMDETICPLDYAQAGQILDDELHDILVKSLPKGVRLTAIFDSCHSGSVLDLPFSYTIDGNLHITETDNRIKAMKAGFRGV